MDDIFLYHLADSWLIVVNAANRAKDLTWLQAHVGRFDIDLRDVSDETAMLALQGPQAQSILQRVTGIDLARLSFHAALEGDVAGAQALIGATGYTGEYGYELFFPAEATQHVWTALLEAGEPEGLIRAAWPLAIHCAPRRLFRFMGTRSTLRSTPSAPDSGSPCASTKASSWGEMPCSRCDWKGQRPGWPALR